MDMDMDMEVEPCGYVEDESCDYVDPVAAPVARAVHSVVASRRPVARKRRHEGLEENGETPWWRAARECKRQEETFTVEFTWRRETIAQYFVAGAGASTRSSTTTIFIRDNGPDDELTSIQLRVLFVASEGEANQHQPCIHRMAAQVVVDEPLRHVYTITLESLFDQSVRIEVLDHRLVSCEALDSMDSSHPVLRSLQAQGCLRMRVRVKPDRNGPLDRICGCC